MNYENLKDKLETIALTASSKIFQLRHPVCPDCKSRLGNPTCKLDELFWECLCCKETTDDPKWAGIWWPINTIIPHLRWRIHDTWLRYKIMRRET